MIFRIKKACISLEFLECWWITDNFLSMMTASIGREIMIVFKAGCCRSACTEQHSWSFTCKGDAFINSFNFIYFFRNFVYIFVLKQHRSRNESPWRIQRLPWSHNCGNIFLIPGKYLPVTRVALLYYGERRCIFRPWEALRRLFFKYMSICIFLYEILFADFFQVLL